MRVRGQSQPFSPGATQAQHTHTDPPVQLTALPPAAGQHPLMNRVGLPKEGRIAPTQPLQQNGRWGSTPAWKGSVARDHMSAGTPRRQARHGQGKRDHFKTVAGKEIHSTWLYHESRSSHCCASRRQAQHHVPLQVQLSCATPGKLEPALGAEQPAHIYTVLPPRRSARLAKPGSWYYSGLWSTSGPKPTWVTSTQDYLLPHGTSHAAKASRGAHRQGHRPFKGLQVPRSMFYPNPSRLGKGTSTPPGTVHPQTPSGKALPGSGVGCWGWQLGRGTRSRVGYTGTVVAKSKAVSILR